MCTGVRVWRLLVEGAGSRDVPRATMHMRLSGTAGPSRSGGVLTPWYPSLLRVDLLISMEALRRAVGAATCRSFWALMG